MWTFHRVAEVFDEYVLRDVIFEVNNLMCGRGGVGTNPNCAGVDPTIWRKLLKRGGVTDDGIEKLIAGGLISQRDTSGPFDPFTIVTIGKSVTGEPPLLSAAEADHLIERILLFQGRIGTDGSIIPQDEMSRHGRELA